MRHSGPAAGTTKSLAPAGLTTSAPTTFLSSIACNAAAWLGYGTVFSEKLFPTAAGISGEPTTPSATR